MLKSLRKNTKVIIWTLIVAFVLWGGYSVGTQFQKEGRVAGEAFGKEVSFQEFDSFYRANQIFSFSESQAQDPETLKQQTWHSIIFSREAKRRKIDVSDEEVKKEVMRLFEAQKIENPTPELYRAWVENNLRQTPQQFETQLRELLRIQKLVQEINSAPVDTPPADEIRKRFDRVQNELSAEIVKFPTAGEAKEFRDKVKNQKDWEKHTGDKIKAEKTGLVALDAWMNTLGVSEEEAFKLHKLKVGEISEPVPAAGQFAVVHVLDKRFANEESFEKEYKEKYAQELTDRAKYQHFLSWSVELFSQANLKDYLPKSESAPPAQ